MRDSDSDTDLTVFRSESGKTFNFYQIAMQSTKEGKDVTEVEAGYRINGELFVPLNE